MVRGDVKNCESAYKFNERGPEYRALYELGVDEDNVENALKFDSSIKVKTLKTLMDTRGEASITAIYNYFFDNNEDIARKIDVNDIKYANILQLINFSMILG